MENWSSKKIIAHLILVFFIAVLWSLPGHAQNPFKNNDRNGDRRLSRDEFPGPPRVFDLKDINGDDYLTPEEMDGSQEQKTKSTVSTVKFPPYSGPLQYVDTHMHLHPLGLDAAMGGGAKQTIGSASENLAKAADNLVSRMNKRGVMQSLVVVVPSSKGRPSQAYQDLYTAVRRYPERLRLMAGGAQLGDMLFSIHPDDVTEEDKVVYRRIAEDVLQDGAAGFGEMILYHLCMTEKHSFKYAEPNHPLFLLLADMAAENDVPIDVHMEAVETADAVSPRLLRSCSKNPEYLTPTIDDFEDLLRHNRNARIVWQHIGWDNTGQMTPDLLRWLLEGHSNLYLSIRIPQRITDDKGNLIPNRLVDQGFRLRPQWRKLLKDFQDRIVVGSDEFVGPSTQATKLAASFEATWHVIGQLSEPVAKKIGGDNARRIYNLKKGN